MILRVKHKPDETTNRTVNMLVPANTTNMQLEQLASTIHNITKWNVVANTKVVETPLGQE